MANLNMDFPIVGKIRNEQIANIKQALQELPGVQKVRVDSEQNHVSVDYTPGLVTIQRMKEAIESQGCDVSDRGDD